ncbi:MAG: imidazole glycerol phosphate synthase subunit HisF [Methanospirillaceae archaeon]|nr:imidazole glycerol phosphate synthase subunit HisF [Methanospirillaceae archaeon]
MFRPRIIPCLLLQDNGLVKTTRFKEPRYIGDPINAVRIFNEKEADELVFLDISLSRPQGLFKKKAGTIQYDLLRKISGECFMPFAYGGGITDIDQIQTLLSIGIEKVAINTGFFSNPGLIAEASYQFGSQSIIASIDVVKGKNGKYEIFTHGGTRTAKTDLLTVIRDAERAGAGEILCTAIDRDGTMEGYDIALVRMVSDAVQIPVIVCGGAGSLQDMADAYVSGHASALAAGSLFVYHGRKRAVLISYPTQGEINKTFPGEV